MTDLQGKVVLVTGATGNLGQATVQGLLGAGATVVGTYRSEEQAAALRAHLGDPPQLDLQALDVNVASAVERCVTAVVELHGRLDALVNLIGGYQGGKPVTALSEEEWDDMFRLNLRPVFRLCRAVLPHMMARQRGAVVNIAARAGEQGSRGAAAYAAAKAGVISLTKSLALEVKEHGIAVNCILPGTLDTPANRRARPEADTRGWVKLEEAAALICFLCAPRGLHGAAIPLYGTA